MTIELADIETILRIHPHLEIAVYLNQEPIGYMIGYEKEKNGSIYYWLAGVDYRY